MAEGPFSPSFLELGTATYNFRLSPAVESAPQRLFRTSPRNVVGHLATAGPILLPHEKIHVNSKREKKAEYLEIEEVLSGETVLNV